jgi:hypothetical protein
MSSKVSVMKVRVKLLSFQVIDLLAADEKQTFQSYARTRLSFAIYLCISTDVVPASFHLHTSQPQPMEAIVYIIEMVQSRQFLDLVTIAQRSSCTKGTD